MRISSVVFLDAATPPFGLVLTFPVMVGALFVLLLWVLLLRGLVKEQTIVFLERIQRIVREFAEFRRKNEELRESEERFRRLAESMRDVVWIVSMDGPKTLFVNTAFERITGRPKQALYDQPNCLELVLLADRAEAISGILRQLLENYECDAEFRISRTDGAIRWLRCRAFSILKDHSGVHQVGCVAEDVTERKQAEEELRQLSGKLMRLQDEERRRIARDLHDSTGQTLAALQMRLAAVEESAGLLNPSEQQALADSLRLARQSSQELRTVAYLLHPPLLEELGLVPALRLFLEGFAQRSGINVELENAPDFGRLAPEIELALFRVVQESLTNIHIHSGSRIAKVRLRRDLSSIRLEVEDSGRGVPRDLLDESGQMVLPLGVGIAGMRERLRQLGGRAADGLG